MSKKHITTKYLIETLINAGYKATEDTDSYGGYIDIFDGLICVGAVRTDKMYCFKISACLKDEYRERLFNILCDYAKTPIDVRKDEKYTLRILGTKLYLTSIDEVEMTVVSDEMKAKLYKKGGVKRAKEFAKKHDIIIEAEKVNATD